MMMNITKIETHIFNVMPDIEPQKQPSIKNENIFKGHLTTKIRKDL